MVLDRVNFMDVNNEFMMSFFRSKNAVKILRSRINSFLNEYEIGIAELTLMKAISDNAIDSDENVNFSDIQGYLFVSKGTVSQLLGSLEKKGFVIREIDKNNRRKLIIVLTPDGEELLSKMVRKLELLLSEIVSRIGEDNAIQAISVINHFADAMEQMENKDFDNILQSVMEEN